MSASTIAFKNLSPIEQQQFHAWSVEIRSRAKKSRRKRLALYPPRLEIIELPPNAMSHQATTDGGKIKISRDLLPASPDLRCYLVAHELGHAEGLHPWISFAAALAPILAVVYWSAAHKWPGGNSRAELVGELFVILVGILILALYLKTMLFEWDADRRAARMLDPNGVAAMLNGIALVRQLRDPSHADFYDKKRDKLQGKRPCWWRPGA